MEHRPAVPPVTRTDRWRYRSAVHAARVLNQLSRTGTVPAPRQSVENQHPRATRDVRPAS